MKRTHQALLALAVAGMIFIPACNKKTTGSDTPEKVEVAVQQLAATAANWNKEDVNALLAYVPEDTAFIQASTRAMEFAAVKKWLDKATASIDKSIKTLQNSRATIPPDRPEFAQFDATISILNTYRELASDFENVAPAWGIDALAHIDSVAYMRDDNLIAQMSLVDGSKFAEKLMPTIDSYLVAMKSLDNTKGEITHSEVKSGDSTWHVYSAKALIDEMEIKDQDAAAAIPSKIAINIGSNLLTVALISEKFDTNTLDKLLKPADKPFTKEALGKLTPTTIMTGFLDITKLVKNLTSPTGIAVLRELELAEGEATEECINEYNSLAAITPRLNIVTDAVNDEVIGKMTVVLSDKEELKKIAALRTKSISITSDKSIAGLNFNLNIPAAIGYIKSLSAAAEAKNYTCSAAKNIPGALKELLEIVANPQLMLFIQGISGINIALDKLDLKSDPVAIEGAINLTGPAVGITAPTLIGLASATSPEFAKLNLTKGQLANDIDFDFEGVKLKLNGLLTDTDLIYATPSYDVKVLSESAKIDANFFDIKIDNELFKLLPTDYIEALDEDLNMTFSVGTDDDGITLITKSKYR